MAAFKAGDDVFFAMAPGGAVVKGVIERVMPDELRIVDEEGWPVRVYPDVHYVVKASDLPERPVLDVPEGW